MKNFRCDWKSIKKKFKLKMQSFPNNSIRMVACRIEWTKKLQISNQSAISIIFWMALHNKNFNCSNETLFRDFSFIWYSKRLKIGVKISGKYNLLFLFFFFLNGARSYYASWILCIFKPTSSSMYFECSISVVYLHESVQIPSKYWHFSFQPQCDSFIFSIMHSNSP